MLRTDAERSGSMIYDFDFDSEGRVTVGMIEVAGVSHYQEAVAKTAIGYPVYLVREPENQYDQYAVRVETAFGEKIGYIPRANSADFSTDLAAGTQYTCVVTENGGLNVDYMPRVVIEFTRV